MSTTYMNLTLPEPSVTIGPEWATTLNTAITAIDAHDHVTVGQRIPTAGLNINAELDFNANSLSNFDEATFKNNTTDSTTVNSAYVKNGDLYFRDSSGNNVRVTSGGALDLSGTGGITGDYTTTSAVAFYTDSSLSFFFQDSATNPAIMSFGTAEVGDGTASLPAYSFTSDKDTGMYSNAANTLRFATAGTQAVSIDATQDVSFAGQLYLPNSEPLNWRNNANSAYLPLTVNTSDALLFNSNPVVTLANGAADTVLKMNAGGTTFEYGKLANANVAASAAIDANKIHDGSVSNTEFGYLDGVTSAIQTQFGTKAGLADANTFTGVNTFDEEVIHKHNATPANPSSGYNKLYFKNDDKLYKLDSAGNELEVGSGTGSGEINYILNSEFESNADGWATYADAAGTTPVDGTGGTANITIAASTDEILRGTKSLKVTKDAANRQGEGFSYDFSIKGQDTSKKLKIQFDFKTNEDAAYASGDIAVYIYDVTNSTLITPVDTSLIAGQNIFQTSFNSTTSTSYRLIFHVASTNASAYDVYIDNVIVGPGMTSQGAAIGDWEDFTPDWDNTTDPTFTASQFKKRRVGGSMEIQFYFNLDTPGTSGEGFAFFLPDGLTPDTSASISTIGQFGVGYLWDGTARNSFTMYSSPSNVKRITALDATFADITWNELATGDYCGIHLSIPVAEWSGKGIVPMLAEDNLSEWTDYTPTVGSTGSAPNLGTNTISAQYRRVGDSMQVRMSIESVLGSGGSGTYLIPLPSGFTIDSNDVNTPADTTSNNAYVGTMHFTNPTDTMLGQVQVYDSTKVYARGIFDAGGGIWGSTFFAFQNGATQSGLIFTVPIVEWKGSQNSLVGYSEASEDNLGLVKAPKILIDDTSTTWSTSNTDYGSITLTPGTWLLSGVSYLGGNSTARRFSMHIATTTGGGSFSDGTRFICDTYETSTGTGCVQLHNVVATVTTDTVYKWSGSATSIAGLSTSSHHFQAVRIG